MWRITQQDVKSIHTKKSPRTLFLLHLNNHLKPRYRKSRVKPVGPALSSPQRQRSHTLPEISGIMHDRVTSLQSPFALIQPERKFTVIAGLKGWLTGGKRGEGGQQDPESGPLPVLFMFVCSISLFTSLCLDLTTQHWTWAFKTSWNNEYSQLKSSNLSCCHPFFSLQEVTATGK